jgi:ribonuclease HII
MTVIAGIDEAGYGPMLGPLVVARSVFEVPHAALSDGHAPDLWLMLRSCVTKAGDGQRQRIAIDDSKKLKRANDTQRPLKYLLRGVMACLCAGLEREQWPTTDVELFQRLGIDFARIAEGLPWYGGEAARLPALDELALGIDVNQLRIAMEQAGVCVREVAAIMVAEDRFNELVATHGSKASTTLYGFGKHLQTMWTTRCDAPSMRDDDALSQARVTRLVCDRLSGRADYTPLLERSLSSVVQSGGEISVAVTHQTDEISRYRVDERCSGQTRRSAVVSFVVESERQHLPVALASMTAKLTRELMMARFNRYFARRAEAKGRELPPTAGYVADARRWLIDAEKIGLIGQPEREMMIRKA